ncbi:MAG: hypothetical protein MI861_00165, partial [Pirellulales bacterium]|nr:hypothetical protein [Pirellulales bacterium]
VKEFERGVLRGHYDRRDERLVDDLEDATSELRSAARRPEDLRRLLRVWHEIECLQQRVEAAIFNPVYYPPNPPLARCWQSVVAAGACFQRELQLLQHPHPIHRWPVGRIEYQPVKPIVVPTRPNRDPFGYDAYRRPFGRPENVLPSNDVPRYRNPSSVPVWSNGAFPSDRYRNRAITIPPSNQDASSRNRVEGRRREVGAAVIGAVLTRLLD